MSIACLSLGLIRSPFPSGYNQLTIAARRLTLRVTKPEHDHHAARRPIRDGIMVRFRSAKCCTPLSLDRSMRLDSFNLSPLHAPDFPTHLLAILVMISIQSASVLTPMNRRTACAFDVAIARS